jgi:hypothetical protein
MNHGRRTFGTRALALAIAGVSLVIVIGGVSAFAAVSRASVAKPLLVIRPGVRGLSVPAAPLAPGDTVQRTATLVNGGSTVMHAVWATVTPSAVSAPPAGLQVRMDRCRVAWTLSGSTLVCSKASVQVAGWRTPNGRAISLPAAAGLKPGATIQLRVSVRLPATAGAASAGRAGKITWTFTAG